MGQGPIWALGSPNIGLEGAEARSGDEGAGSGGRPDPAPSSPDLAYSHLGPPESGNTGNTGNTREYREYGNTGNTGNTRNPNPIGKLNRIECFLTKVKKHGVPVYSRYSRYSRYSQNSEARRAVLGPKEAGFGQGRSRLWPEKSRIWPRKKPALARKEPALARKQ